MLAVCTLVVFAPSQANADMGPKPSINITLQNLGDKVCYGTILSESITTGPFSAYAPDKGWDYKDLGNFDSNYYHDDDYHNEEVERIWQIFVDYVDADGYFFLQLWWKLEGESNNIRWGYHPPYSFKLLLYFPESDAFVTSEIYERYAFDSYYTVDVSDVSSVQLLKLSNNYDYFGEVVGLLFRIALTVAIELAIAFVFLIKGRKPILIILITNVVTQIGLNVALNLIYYFSGALVYLIFFVLLEIAVFVVEAIVYSIFLRKQGVPIWKSLLYALVANAVTAVAGFFLANWLPGMF